MNKKWLKRLAAYGFSACMIVSYCPVQAATTGQASSVSEAGEYVINLASYAGSEIKIPAGKNNVRIVGNPAVNYNKSIKVERRTAQLHITLDNVKINSSQNALDLNQYNADNKVDNSSNPKTYLIIKGDNQLNSTGGNGIAVYTGASVEISAAGSGGSLTVNAGSSAAGIGGRYYPSADIKKGNGQITINSGTYNITGGSQSAGIGSAGQVESKLEDITINGGNITATGGSNGAGIGAGTEVTQDMGTITINKGTVVAIGGNGGAGIGSGTKCKSTFDIVINDAAKGGTTLKTGYTTVIKATGNGGGAGIGGGYDAEAHDITILGGQIEATGSDAGGSKGSAGIGGGAERSFNVIQIGQTGAAASDNPYIKNVSAGTQASAIGTGCQGQTAAASGERIYLNSGIIDQLSATGGASGIGGGYHRGCKYIEVGNTRIGKVDVSGGGAGIGTGYNGADCELKTSSNSALYIDANGNNNLGRGTNDAGSSNGTVSGNLDGNIFMGTNVVDTQLSSSGLGKYAFECYTGEGDARTKMTGKNFIIRHFDDRTIDLTPETDSNGRIYGLLKDFGENHLSSTGFYFQLEEGGKTYYATETARKTEGGLTVFEMDFKEGKSHTTTAKVEDPGANKIVPFSYSNIEVETEITRGENNGRKDEVTDPVLKIDFKPVAGDITPFDLADRNKFTFSAECYNAASAKWETDAVVTQELNNARKSVTSGIVDVDPTTKTITIKYTPGMDVDKKYKIKMMIPCKLSGIGIDNYHNNEVKTGHKKNLEATLTYYAAAHNIIDGRDVLETPKLETKTGAVKAAYWYITKVN